MNLIERQTRPSVISSFRSFQYAMLPYFLNNGIEYLLRLGLKYDEKLYSGESSIQVVDDYVYSHIRHYSCRTFKLKLLDEKNQWFFYFSMPELLEGTFFKLNSVLYIPIFYISDEPIVIKEKSVVLQSTFQPLTIYFKDNRIIFMGHNIRIDDFFTFMMSTWDKKYDDYKTIITDDLQISPSSKSITQIVDYLAEKFFCQKDIVSLKARLNELFFDDWTKQVYHQFYNIDPTLDNVIRLTVEMKEKFSKPSFVDLRHKRLTFMEPLLRPYFKSIATVAQSLLKGYLVKSIKMDPSAIVKHFFGELNGNILYDTTNGFSGILAHKASFKNPYGKSKPPKEVSSIHWTHKGRVCTNSITNDDPGEMICLVPDQEIDLKYGIFQFSEEELNRSS